MVIGEAGRIAERVPGASDARHIAFPLPAHRAQGPGSPIRSSLFPSIRLVASGHPGDDIGTGGEPGRRVKSAPENECVTGKVVPTFC